MAPVSISNHPLLCDSREFNNVDHSFLNNNASWRQMPVAQPPISKLQITFVDRHPTFPGGSTELDHVRTGLVDFGREGMHIGAFYDCVVSTMAAGDVYFGLNGGKKTWHVGHNVPQGIMVGPGVMPTKLPHCRMLLKTCMFPTYLSRLTVCIQFIWFSVRKATWTHTPSAGFQASRASE